MERHALKTTNAKRREPVLVLQPPEVALDSATAPVEVAPPLRLARDQRVTPVGLKPYALGLTLAGRAAPLGSSALEVGPGERPAAVLARRYVVMRAGLLLANLSDDRTAAAILAAVVDRAGVVALVHRA